MGACGFHFTGKVISRSAGRSAVKHAAYITAQNFTRDELGEVCDYRRKKGVDENKVLHYAPENAPAWAQDVQTGWNAVEAIETRKNSTLARDYIAAFPHQLDDEQRLYILKDFLREEFQRRGFMVTGAIHEPDEGGSKLNHHAHIMFSERQLDANGWAKNKDRYFSSFETREEALLGLKVKWAELGARQLERIGLTEEAERWRHGYMTLEEQRDLAQRRGDYAYAEACAGEPTRHLGPAASALKRKGRENARTREYDATVERNQLREELAALDRKQRRLDRHLTRLEAAELEQGQTASDTPTHYAPDDQTQRGTSQYAIDKLADIAEQQAQQGAGDDAAAQEAARRKAFDEAWQRHEDEQNQDHGYRI